ncbi:asialoglycoprotein receptor 1-like [Anoplopoma fimbria]|uniref:asialoglycoprotein receptor 1-like n=1 Tax=Anoplopoma fimbria TaxID=229290 RepID=UPI0023ED6FDA|nr:asialoglycoprotein receptor 1-like [Anoplopoma fimbria]
MVGHQCLPWINNPTSGSISVTSAKQDQETYNNESDSKPEWKSLLFDYQNISDNYLTISTANNDLRRDNDLLKEHSAWLQEQTKLLNNTLANLMSANLALSLESTELTEQIVNLISTNLRLTQEHERMVRYTSEQEVKELNMSQTIKHLLDSNTLREEDGRRLSQINSLLRDELVQVKEKNQKLQDINDKFQGEVKNLSDDCERLTELQEQNQNLSSVLMTERQEVEEREERRTNEMDRKMVDIDSIKEAFHSLDLYCPVVNLNTKERICRKCPDSWSLFENKCYFFSSRLQTWSSSRAWCQTQGGDLLIINSEPEQSFVFESSQTLQPSSSRLWIGLTDVEEEGEWKWVDGSRVSSDVQFWLSRPGLGTEPDDWKLDDPLGEDCGHMDTSENELKSWMDGSCETPYRWICENNV